jgi:hypothetical protein
MFGYRAAPAMWERVAGGGEPEETEASATDHIVAAE